MIPNLVPRIFQVFIFKIVVSAILDLTLRDEIINCPRNWTAFWILWRNTVLQQQRNITADNTTTNRVWQ